MLRKLCFSLRNQTKYFSKVLFALANGIRPFNDAQQVHLFQVAEELPQEEAIGSGILGDFLVLEFAREKSVELNLEEPLLDLLLDELLVL